MAITLWPNLHGVYYNYGNLLKDLGRLGEAVALYHKALLIEPEYAEGNLNLGNAFQHLGWFESAISSYDRAIVCNPQNPEAFLNRGVALRELKRLEKAIDSYGKAIFLKPDFADACLNLGVALQDLKFFEEAVLSYDAAIALKGDLAEACSNRGNALSELDRVDEAAASYEKAICLNPAFTGAYFNFGTFLKKINRQGEALAPYARALAISPRYAEAHLNHGIAMKELGRLNEAFESYEKALGIKPDFVEVHLNRGVALKELKRIDQAIASYDVAISIRSDYADAHANKAIALLLAGDFRGGLALYEWRKRGLEPVGNRMFLKPLWLGDGDISGKSILVHYEQGLGDTIQFCRYLLLLIATGARVLFAPHRKLRRLVSSFGGLIEIVDIDDADLVFDYHIPLLSLPLAFNTIFDTIPRHCPYLTAEASLVAKWRERIGLEGFRIGICWQGSRNKIDIGRSFPLSLFASIAGIAHVRLISLHRGDGEEQLASLPEGMRVETPGDDFDAGPDAFLDTAAVMKCCDLVITSDTAVAHLAGALGVKTWVALKHVPDGRWMLDRDDCPWYPTMRLFRQASDGDWRGVFDDMEQALQGEI